MKNKTVYINREPVFGPWGGGTKFVNCLVDTLQESGHNITFDLSPDVDVIFCFDPRPNNKGLWYQDMLNHKIKYNSKIVQRVGDVGSHSKPGLTNLLKQCTKYSDLLIFPSIWAKEYIHHTAKNYHIINNAPMEIFKNLKTRKLVNNLEVIRVITHHWSTNEKKGFDVYSKLGALIKETKLNIAFTYVGRWNNKYSSEGIELIEPLDAKNLANLLPKHDIYLTASIEEAGANHVLEAIAAGLPIVYRQGGGSINEYCAGYGEEYNGSLEDLIANINKVKSEYKNYHKKILNFNNTIKSVTREYVRLICQI